MTATVATWTAAPAVLAAVAWVVDRLAARRPGNYGVSH